MPTRVLGERDGEFIASVYLDRLQAAAERLGPRPDPIQFFRPRVPVVSGVSTPISLTVSGCPLTWTWIVSPSMIRMTVLSGCWQAAQSDRGARGLLGQASGTDELVAGKPANQPLQFQDAERGQDLRGRQAGAGDQLIDADGMVSSWPGKDRSWSPRQSSAGVLDAMERLVPWRVHIWRGTILFIWWSSVAARGY